MEGVVLSCHVNRDGGGSDGALVGADVGAFKFVTCVKQHGEEISALFGALYFCLDFFRSSFFFFFFLPLRLSRSSSGLLRMPCKM